MAKKKMTPSEAAAARRPDDWVSPEAERQAAKKEEKPVKVDVGPKNLREAAKDDTNRGLYLLFIAIFICMGAAAPFLVVYFSQLLGTA